jgi:hypothetical protein
MGPAKAGKSSALHFLHDEEGLMQLARDTGLVVRAAKKLTPRLLLHSFLEAGCLQRASTRHLAMLVGLQSGDLLARQSLWERLRRPASDFMANVLAQFLKEGLLSQSTALKIPGVHRVLVADSSVVAVHPRLRKAFPGSSNQACSMASARMQFAFDLLSGSVVHCGLHAFTRPDQAAALDILPSLLPGDLLMRDLGYFTLEAFSAIAQRQSFFLSRLRLDVSLYDAEGRPLRLLKELRRRTGRSGKAKPIVLQVKAGEKHRFPLRLIAVPLPQEQADERRRRARADRDKRLNHSKEYYALLSWTLLITNLPEESLSAEQMQGLYAARWRIENIFKAWKSLLHPEAISTHFTNEYHLRCLIHTQQMLLVIAAQQGYMGGGPPGPNRPRRSLFKCLDLLLLTRTLLPTRRSNSPRPPGLQCLIDYYCCYEKRKRMPLPFAY